MKYNVHTQSSAGEKKLEDMLAFLGNVEKYTERLKDLKEARKELEDKLALSVDVAKVMAEKQAILADRSMAAQELGKAKEEAKVIVAAAKESVITAKEKLVKIEDQQKRHAASLQLKENALNDKVAACEKLTAVAEAQMTRAEDKWKKAVVLEKTVVEERVASKARAARMLEAAAS